ncbi:uncharacterized protein LOC135388370 isoform X2 [Ornithodoros turicata]|uniref:uncharacterized protein LOC135388370 isoform X2 n=1 Tax=Ornithodoros turicata TaxID=34597 RepID=UPI003138EA76
MGTSGTLKRSCFCFCARVGAAIRNYFFPPMIPDPDYSDTEPDEQPREVRLIEEKSGSSSSRMPGMAMGGSQSGEGLGSRGGHPLPLGEEGLIIPKKPSNPCLESTERKNLHRELLFNQKIGKNVLGQKSELQKAMEKVKDDQKRKELEGERQNKRTALEKRLEEQANKLRMQDTEADSSLQSDLRTEESEFLRVHARVCAHSLPVGSKS